MCCPPLPFGVCRVAVVLLIQGGNGGLTPTKDEPGAYTKALVEEAIERYENEGLDLSIEHWNNPENVDGEWYVFIVNREGYTIAHHNANFRNREPSERVDSTGYFYGDALLGATKEGRWVDYHILNPETGEDDLKHTWAVRQDGYIFGSGWYER